MEQPKAFVVDDSSLRESLDWRWLGSAPLCHHHWHPSWLGGLEESCWDFSSPSTSPMNLCLSGLPKVRGKVRLENGVVPCHHTSPGGRAHQKDPLRTLKLTDPSLMCCTCHPQVTYELFISHDLTLQQSKNPRVEGWSPPAPAVTQPGCFSTLLMGFGAVGTCSPTFTLVPGGGESSFQACRWQHDSQSP